MASLQERLAALRQDKRKIADIVADAEKRSSGTLEERSAVL